MAMADDNEELAQEPIRAFEFLSPVLDLVLGFTDFTDEVRDEAVGLACWVTEVTVDMPVEMVIQVDDSGKVRLASAPPTQQIETTIFPVLHRMRLGLVGEHDPERE
ncbi:MAG: hypothetical protein KKE83_06335 [Proteobacteria bacterium]|nr:hypothetical protein [Pseudomonadota bacterium]MBU2619287.1 hypothetical protein [Pseudomonadota bacterium]